MEAEQRRAWVVEAAELTFGRGWVTEMAARSGLSRRAVAMWRDGESCPRERVAARLAALMVSRAAALVDLARRAPIPADAPEWAAVFPAPGHGAGPLMSEQWRGDPSPTSGVPMPHAMTEAELEQYVTADFGPLQAPPDHLVEGRYHTTESPAAAPAPAPAAKVLTEKQLARIERALEARGVRVLLGPPGDPTIRARAEADRAAGRVVYVADLPQHADLIGE